MCVQVLKHLVPRDTSDLLCLEVLSLQGDKRIVELATKGEGEFSSQPVLLLAARLALPLENREKGWSGTDLSFGCRRHVYHHGRCDRRLDLGVRAWGEALTDRVERGSIRGGDGVGGGGGREDVEEEEERSCDEQTDENQSTWQETMEVDGDDVE